MVLGTLLLVGTAGNRLTAASGTGVARLYRLHQLGAGPVQSGAGLSTRWRPDAARPAVGMAKGSALGDQRRGRRRRGIWDRAHPVGCVRGGDRQFRRRHLVARDRHVPARRRGGGAAADAGPPSFGGPARCYVHECSNHECSNGCRDAAVTNPRSSKIISTGTITKLSRYAGKDDLSAASCPGKSVRRTTDAGSD
jgi:hypothetical protein